LGRNDYFPSSAWFLGFGRRYFGLFAQLSGSAMCFCPHLWLVLAQRFGFVAGAVWSLRAKRLGVGVARLNPVLPNKALHPTARNLAGFSFWSRCAKLGRSSAGGG